MSNDCKDRDLLALEPAIFTGGVFDSQNLASGQDGATSGTTFSSEDADFAAAGVEAGMVLGVYSSSPAEPLCYEVVSVDSATALTVSVLRADEAADAIAPPAGSDQKFLVRTFAPQIANVRASLLERLRETGQAQAVSGGDFVESNQLRQAIALGTLAVVFTARASNSADKDANWAKAEFYRNRYAEAVSALRLASDTNGDGYAERTRSLGNINLRRS